MLRKTLTLVFIIFAVVSMVSSLAAQSTSQMAKAVLTEGEQLLNGDKLVEAEAKLRTVIDDYASTEWSWWARYHLSTCLLRQKRFDESILEARKIVNQYPHNAPQLAAAWAQLNVGLAYLDKKDIDSAIWELERVEQVLGKHEDRGPLLKAKCNLALTHHGRNNRKKAIALADEMLDEPTATDADKAWALAICGTALLGDKKTDEGLSCLRKAKELYPEMQEQMLLVEKKILENYLSCHDYDGLIKEAKAIAEDDKACESRTRQARYYIIRANLYSGNYSGVIEEAQTFFTRYTTPAPDYAQIHKIKAHAYAMMKDYKKAIACLEEALAENSKDRQFNANIEWDIATCYKASGDMQNAQIRYQRLVDLYPDSHLSVRATKELTR